MARPRLDVERREAILKAFESCVIRKGIERTTLEDIAREAGQPRSLVRYFAGNREDLIAQLIERLLSKTVERVASMRARSNGDTTKLVQIYFDEFFSDDRSNSITLELWRMATLSEKVSAQVQDLYSNILSDFANDLAGKGVESNSDRTYDGAYASFALGLGMAILEEIGVSPRQPEALAQLAQTLALGRLPLALSDKLRDN